MKMIKDVQYWHVTSAPGVFSLQRAILFEPLQIVLSFSPFVSAPSFCPSLILSPSVSLSLFITHTHFFKRSPPSPLLSLSHSAKLAQHHNPGLCVELINRLPGDWTPSQRSLSGILGIWIGQTVILTGPGSAEPSDKFFILFKILKKYLLAWNLQASQFQGHVVIQAGVSFSKNGEIKLTYFVMIVHS